MSTHANTHIATGNTPLWLALQQSAQVGVERLPLPPALLATPPADAPATRQMLHRALVAPAASRAQALLRAAAVATVLARAGGQPGRVDAGLVAVLPPAAAVSAETRPACTDTDARLQALMATTLQDVESPLLTLLLARLEQGGHRLPPALLVAALELGRQSVALRRWLLPVLGERGRWLAGLNPAWRYASGVEETASPEQVWQEGSIDQRVALLQRERDSDPAPARERLQASLKELPAKERLPLVQALGTGLGMDDEPLLAQLLASDRSKEVREAAARLLSRLPGSSHSQRISGWMRDCLHQDGKGRWTLEPLEEGPPEWEQHGISLKPTSGGAKAWQLQQLVALTPLSFWPQTLGMAPLELVRWANRTDWKADLHQGWLTALQQDPDPQWLDALPLLSRRWWGSASIEQAMLARLTPAQREALCQSLLDKGEASLPQAIERIAAMLPPGASLAPHLSAQLLDAVSAALHGPAKVRGDWQGHQGGILLLACARVLDGADLPRLAQLWRVPAPPDAAAAASADAETSTAVSTLSRPWDSPRMAEALERTVHLRTLLEAALRTP